MLNIFKLFNLFTDVTTGTMRYFKPLGSGRLVSVQVSDKDLEKISLNFQRKIEPADVCDGKLVSLVTEEVKHRGGKRVTSLELTYDSAEALHKVLGLALKDMRRRRSRRIIENFLLFTVFETMRSKRTLF